MNGYWIKFTDGTSGYCDGVSAYDAVQIAEHFTGKVAEVGDNDNVIAYRPLPAPFGGE